MIHDRWNENKIHSPTPFISNVIEEDDNRWLHHNSASLVSINVITNKPIELNFLVSTQKITSQKLTPLLYILGILDTLIFLCYDIKLTTNDNYKNKKKLCVR